MLARLIVLIFILVFTASCGGGGNPLGDATDFEDNHGDNSIVRENRAPVLLNPGQQNWTEGAVNVININDADTGTDFDDYGDAISYTCYYDTFVDGVVAKSSECISLGGVSFDANTGSLQWVPDFDQGGVTVGAAAGSISYEFIVTGRDSYFNGPLEDEIIFVGVVNDTNDYPVIDAIGTQSVDEGSMLSVDVADGGDDQDIDTETLSYTCFYDNVVDNNVASTNACSSLTGATFNTSTGVLSWTPDYTMGGNTVGGNEDYEFRVHAYDTYTTADLAPALQGPLTDDEYFDVNVDHVNRPPSLNPMADDSVLEGQALATLDPSDTNGGGDIDFDGEPITYTCYYDQTDNDTVSEIPGNLCSTLTGISFTASTGRLDWTPNFLQAGVYEFVFVGQDNSGEPDDIDRVYTTITVVNVPSVGLTNPVNGIYINATTNSTTYPVDGTCSEAGQTVWIDIDGANAASPVGFVCDGTNYSGTIDTTGFSQGARGFQAFLTDAWTQTVSSNVNTITYDTVYPSIGINSPSEGSYINIASDSASFTFTGTCSENTQTVNGSANGISFSGYSNPTCDGANFNGTFDSTALAEGVLSLTASVSDAAGNVSESVAVSVTRDVTRPTLPNVTIFSNNAGSPLVGKIGDVVTLGIYADEALSATPTVLIAGSAATVTGSASVWTAQYTLVITDPTGLVSINVAYADEASNAGLTVTNTTDGTSVTIDVTPPTLDVVTILSNNSDTGRAKVGDTVSVGVIASETLASDPTMTVDGQTMAITGSGVNWTGTYVLAGGENEGTLNFTVTYSDLALNTGTPTVATTDGTSVIFDETLPSLGTIEIASDATDTTRSRVGDTITLSLIGTEALLATPTVLVENQTATVAGSGVDWTATYTMTGTDTEGTIDFTVTYYDLASNGAVDSTMTTNGSSVIFDRQVPTLSNVTMYSSNANPTVAAIGDTVTVGIYASENLLATPSVTLDNQVMSVAGATDTWTVTYVMTGTESEGVLSLSVTFTDLAYNDGVDVLTTTDGTGVEFDNSMPSLTNVTIFSSNSYDTTKAISGNTVTVGFSADEDLMASPTVNIFSNPAIVTGSGTNWTATYVLTGLELEGVADFTITFSDLSGNGPVNATETTDLSSVSYDKTPPELNILQIVSNNSDSTLAKEGDQVTISLISNEALLATPTVLVQSQTATVVGSGVNWTATYTMLLTDTESVIEHTVTYYDSIGNGASVTTATTDSSSVRFDRTKPTLPNFTMVSSNTVPTLAKAGDVVTAGIYSSESLQATPTVHVLGGNATLSGSGTVWSATYTIQGSDTEGPVDISITFSDLASNEGVQVLTTTDASNIIFDNTLPTIPNVSILSDNADPTRATVGDTISLGFSGLESLMATPTVEIASFAATVTGGPLHWTASYLMSGLESTGVLDLSITFNDLAGNVGTPTVATTDGSSVNFDQTPPTLSNVTIFSNNADTTRAKVGDTVTIGIYADETLAADPTITVDGQTMSIAGSGSVWTGTYVMAGGESETVLDFTVTYQDTTGNVGTPTVATTDSTSVTFDETLPDLGTIEIATSNTDTVRARAGDTITLSLIGTEALLATPTVLVEDQTATVAGSGVDWTATYVMTGTDTEGVIDFTVMYYDLTSNGVVNSTITTNGSSITFDRQIPTLPNVTMSSSNTDSTRAVVGDTITVGIYSSEALLATPSVSLANQGASVTGSGTVWTATYGMLGTEAEGVLALSITFSDLAYNDGVDVLTTTDGSGVDYDNSPPVLENVTIFSNNADTTLATTGNTVTIGFYSDEDLLATPSVLVEGSVANVAGSGSVWSATYGFNGTETDGVVDFTITFSDLGGNAGTPTVATTDSSQVTFDKTAPDITVVEISSNHLNPTWASVGNQISLTLVSNEALMLTPTVKVQSQTAAVTGSGLNWTATYTLIGFEEEAPTEISVTYFDLAGNAGPTETTTTNGSYVIIDMTGPSLSPVTIASSNASPTVAKPGDTITVSFTGDSDLDLTPVVLVDDQTATVTGSATLWSATYVITANENEGVVPFSITYVDLAGNSGNPHDFTTDSSYVVFDKAQPELSNVSILSDNADPTKATVGDTISLGFIGSESLMTTPTVSVSSFSATITGGPVNWTASYLMSGAESPGVLDFTISYNDLAGNVGTPTVATTDGSSVTFDQAPPTLSNVTIFSNNADTTRAKVGDTVTIGIYADETLAADPTITVDGQTMSIAGSGSVWTGTYVMAGGESETVLDFTVTYQDTTGNVGTPTVATTDGSSVTFDETLPSLGTIELATNATDTTRAKAGDTITFSLIGSEALLATPTVLVENQTATVVGSGFDWTATYAFAGTETQGTVDFTVTYYDLTSNGAVDSTMSTNASAVIFDSVVPTLPNVTMFSSNADSTLAVVGDTVTVGIYASEALLATPTASVDSQSMNLTGSSMVWTATYVITGSENEGVLPLSITFTDLAYNDGVDVLTTTDGSGVDYDNSPPSLSNVTIFSDNADTTRAKVLDTITIGFTADENLQSSPSVTILAASATVTGSGSVWTATYTTVGGENDGVVDFTITYSDVGGNPGTPTVSTTDSSQVIFDEVNPSLDALEIVSNNPDTTRAKVGDTITLSIVGAEALLATPTVDIASQSATVAGFGLNWTATYVMTSSENTGSIDYTVTYYDLASNGAVVSTITTNSSAVDFDKTLPSLDLVTMSSSNGISTLAAVGDTITVGIYADEILLATPTVDIDNNSASVTGSGMVWTASYAMTNSDVDGVVDVSITYLDLASNVGVQALSTTDGSVVTFDKTAPTLPNVTIFSDNAVSQTLAIAGDVVSLAFYGDESLTATPTVTIAGSSSVTITGGPTAWTSTYLMTGGEPTGAVEFTVTYSDLAGNPGLDVTSTTDGSTVGIDVIPPTLTNVSIISNNANYSTLAKENDVVTLAFTADENLTATPTVTIDGSSAATITGGPITWSADYTILSTTTEAPLAFTITYTDIAGLSGTPTVASTDNTTVTVDLTAPNLTTVDLVSDATNTYMAKDGDNIFATIIANEALFATPTVNILGNPATSVSGIGLNWTGTYNIAGLETQGNVPVSIDFADLAGNTGTTVTTLTSGGVTYDRTRPDVDIVTIFSTNTDTTLAVVGDTITVAFYTSEALEATPVVSIASQTATVIGSAGVWSASYQMTSTDAQGVVDFTVTGYDLAYNVTSPTYSVLSTDGTSVNFDRAAPSLTNVTILSDNSDITKAKVGDTISVGFYADESLMLTPTVTILAQAATVTGSGDTWTATYQVAGGEDEGVVDFTISYNDLAGNAGTPTYATTDSSQVIFDETNPSLSTLEIASDSTNTVLAKVGDTITLSIVGNEALLATPTVAVENQTATVVGAGLNWTATYTMTSSQVDGVVDFTVTFYDAFGNGAVEGTITTDSSSVTFDKTLPTLPTITVASANAVTTLATVGDTITVGIYSDEALLATPTVEIGSNAATITGSGMVWSATYVMTDAASDGAIDVSVTYFDLAYNEGVQALTTTDGSYVTFDKTPPTLSPVTIYSDNTSSNRAIAGDVVTLAFTGDESLMLTPTVTIEGSGANTITGGPTLWTALYTVLGSEGDGVVDFTISYNDLVGNVGTPTVATTDLTSVLIDATAPSLTYLTIYSDNTDTTRAKVGNTVTVNLIASESLASDPTITVEGQIMTVTGSGLSWTGTYVMLSGDNEGVLDLTVAYSDLAGNVGTPTTATTDSSSVTFDKTDPELSTLLIASDNTDTTRARVGDEIILSIVGSEALLATPTVDIASQSATVVGSGFNWTATYTLTGTDSDGIVEYTVTYYDLASNGAIITTETTDSSSVDFDKTNPSLANVSVLSDNAITTLAKIGDTISLGFTGSESLLATPTVSIEGTNVSSITGGPLNWTALYTVDGSEGDGVVEFTVSYNDLASNVGTPTVATTDGSLVTLDATAPTITYLTIYSGNTDTTLAKVGDTITVGLVANESLAVDPSITVAGNDMTITGSGVNWTGTYVMQAGDDEGTLEYTVTYSDLVGNVGTPTSATTDGSLVIFDETNPTLSVFTAVSDATNTAFAKVGDTVTLSIVGAEALLATPTVSVGGQTATVVGSGVDWTATYTLVGGDNEGVLDLSVSYYDITGNGAVETTITTDGSFVTFDETLPQLSNVTIFSDNATTTLAKENDTITIGFTANENLTATPTVAILEQSATVSGSGMVWTATYTTTSADSDGVVPFTITYNDEAYNDGTPTVATTDGSSVTLDKSPPILTYASLFSDNSNPETAKLGDTITLVFTGNEALTITPTVTIAGATPTIVGSGATWTATHTMTLSEPQGAVEYTITYSDLAGNVGTPTAYYRATNQSNLELWLDAYAGSEGVFNDVSCSTPSGVGDAVACYKDLSGNGRHATQSTSADRPILLASGAIDFDGATDYLDLDLDFTSGLSHHAFIVTNVTNYTNIYGAANGSAGDQSLHVGFRNASDYRMNYWSHDYYPVIGTEFQAGQENILQFSWQVGTGKYIYANGTLQGSNVAATGPGVPSGGGRISNVVGQGFLDANIHEMLFFSGSMPSTEREKIEGYLACKWNLQGFLDVAHPYKTFCIKTTDGSSVIYDYAQPTLTNVTIFSDNADTSQAKNGDTVSVGIIASEALQATPTVTIANKSTTVTGTDTFWTATYTIDGSEVPGVATISITFSDVASNDGTPVTATTDGTSVNIDYTAPTLPNVSIFSSATNTSIAGVGQTITVSFESDETLMSSPIVLVMDQTATVTGSTTDWTATYVVDASDSQGSVEFTITYSDPASNAGNPIDVTTDGSSIFLDKTNPTIGAVVTTKVDGSYTTGELIDILVTFDEIVEVTGTPVLVLETGTTDQTVSYTAGSGSQTLTFSYVVQAGDTSLDLDYISTSALVLSAATINDIAGNSANTTLPTPGAAASLGGSSNLVIDTIAGSVQLVTSPKTNGSYRLSESIDIEVYFNENIYVVGTPTVTLETGVTDQTISYTSGSGTQTLTFNYVVSAGDNSSDLEYVGVTTLTPSVGGSLRDFAGNDANLTLPTPGAGASLSDLKDLVIDTTAPTVLNIDSTIADGAYPASTSIDITVYFDEIVNVTNNPEILLETGGTDQSATYTAGTGTQTLTFNYVVSSGDVSADLAYHSIAALDLATGTIDDVAGNNSSLTLPTPGAVGSLSANRNIVIDTSIPSVTEVLSTKADGSYTIGESIDVLVLLDEAVTVTGTPTVTLETGASDQTATYTSGSGTATLTFNYVVAAGANSSDLDYASVSALVLGGATVQDSAGNDAALTFANMGSVGSISDNQDIVIDTVVPTLSITTTTAIALANETAYYVGGLCSENTRDVGVDIDGGAVVATATCTAGAWGINTLDVSAATDDPSVTVSASHDDLAGNTTVTALTVIKDTILPTISLATPATISVANESSYSLAGTCSENTADVTVDIDSGTVLLTATCASGSWTETGIDVSGVADSGAVTILVSHDDAVSNGPVSITGTAYKDSDIPGVTSVSISSSYTNINYADVGHTVTLYFTTDEPITNATVTIDSQAATVSNVSGNDWKADLVMVTGSSEATLGFTLDFTDVVGNAGVQVTSTTNGSYVIFDETQPDFTPRSIATSNAQSDLAVVGDTITYTVTASEKVENVVMTIAGNAASVVNTTGNVWVGTYVIDGTETNGYLATSVDGDDLAGNARNRTGVTDGSQVGYGAVKLIIQQEPTDVLAGDTITPHLVVYAVDPANNIDVGYTGNIDIEFNVDPSAGTAVIGGTTSLAAAAGVATFTDINVDVAATGYEFQFDSTGLTSVNSASFNVTANSANGIAFIVQPIDSIVNENMSRVKVAIVDASNNIVTSATDAITLSFGTDPTSGTANIGGTLVVNAVSGVAIFDDLDIDTVDDDFTFNAAASGFTTVTSDTFDITSSIATGIGVFGLDADSVSDLYTGSLTDWDWDFAQYDTTYYDHSFSTNSTEIEVKVAGDYFVSYTIPHEIGIDGERTQIRSEIKVNGVVINTGSDTAYIREEQEHWESSNHCAVLLDNLSVGDKIELSTIGHSGVSTVRLTGAGKMYIEYIDSSRTVFSGISDRTVSGTGFNDPTPTALEWTQVVNNGYTHSDTTDPQNIVIGTTGAYFVTVNLPVDTTANTRQSPILTVKVDGTTVTGGIATQGYMRLNRQGGIHWSGFIPNITAGQTLTIETELGADDGSVTVSAGDMGSIFVENVSIASDVFAAYATDLTSGTNWNINAGSTVKWDNQQVNDASVFSHSNSTNPHQITVQSDGDYLVVFNTSNYSTSNRSNPRMSLRVNGTNVLGGQTKRNYIRDDDGHRKSSSSLVFLLRDLKTGDVIDMHSQRQSNAWGDVTNLEDAILYIQKK